MIPVAPWITVQARIQIAQQLGRRQRTFPTTGHHAHDIGLLWFWVASSTEDRAERAIAWRQVIANWAPLLVSDGYWQEFAEQRRRVYTVSMPSERWQSAQQVVIQRLRDQILEHDRQAGAHEPSLRSLLAIETRAFRALTAVGGLAIGAGEFACGPLLAHDLGLLPDIALKARERYALDPGQPAVAELLLCFSELALAASHLDDAPAAALTALTAVTCALCNQPRRPAAPLAEAITPRLCDRQCAAFAERNPAYALLPDGDRLLHRDALAFAADALLGIAGIELRELAPDLARIGEHWRDSLAAAAAAGRQDTQRERVAEAALRASDAFRHAEQDDVAITVLEAASALVDHRQLRVTLAALLAIRGRATRKANRAVAATVDLRRSLALDPDNETIREQMLIALDDAGTQSVAKPAQQQEYRDEFVVVLREGLEINPNHKRWREMYNKSRYQREEGRQPELSDALGDGGEALPLWRSGQADQEVEANVLRMLTNLDQRYEPQGPGLYVLPAPKGSAHLPIELEIMRDFIALTTPLDINAEALDRALNQLLLVAHDLFCCKVALGPESQLLLLAHVPLDVLNIGDLRQIISDMQQVGALPAAELLSPEALDHTLRNLRVDSYWYRTNAISTRDLYRPRQQANNVASDLPFLFDRLGIACKADGDGRFIVVTGQSEDALTLTAECQGKSAVRFRMRYDLPRSGRRLWITAAQLNATLDVCKAVPDDTAIEFLYDLPSVHEDALRQMLERMGRCAARYRLDFAL